MMRYTADDSNQFFLLKPYMAKSAKKIKVIIEWRGWNGSASINIEKKMEIFGMRNVQCRR